MLGVLCTTLLLGIGGLRAEHFSGVSITYDCQGGNMYKVRLNIIADCSGAPMIPQILKFSNDCGITFQVTNLVYVSSQEVSPLCGEQILNSTCHTGGTLPGFKLYRYETTVYLFPCDKWTISWDLCCRSTAVNLADATPGIYVEATLDNTGGLCDDSPAFQEAGVPFGCTGSPISFNFGFTDSDANDMVFSLIAARLALPVPANIIYRSGYSATQPLPGLTIDQYTGQLNFSTNIAGFYVIVVKVTTYDATGKLIGTVMRDQVFIINPCDEAAPASPAPPSSTYGIMIGSNSVGVCPGQYFCVDVSFSDSNPAAVMSVTSNATTVLPGATFSVSGTNPAVARVCWTGNAVNLPNNVYIQASDNACPIDNVTSRSIFIGNCFVLPIELLDFSAVPEDDAVHVAWSTATERNNDHFTIERSTDGLLFTVIGVVDGAGDSEQTLHYAFKDDAPLSGMSYYRLGQTDIGGGTSYSKVVPVRFMRPTVTADWDGGAGWTVRGLETAGDWTLMDMVGNTVAQGSFGDEGMAHIEAGGLATAFHLLVLNTATGRHVLKLPPSGMQVSVTATTTLR